MISSPIAPGVYQVRGRINGQKINVLVESDNPASAICLVLGGYLADC